MAKLQFHPKFLTAFLISCILIISMPLSASALTINTQYSDLNNGTQFSNMLNYATRYDNFYNSKFIAFRDTQNSYYLVWGDSDDFDSSNTDVTGSNVSYVRYWRQSNTADWQYTYVENDTLSLTLDKLVTTNMDSVYGFGSVQFDEWEFWTSIRKVAIVFGSVVISLFLILLFRR